MPFPIIRTLRPPADWPATLTVVIDTEEEFDWSAPFDATATAVENIASQSLAQAIFDDHGVVPTYVIDYAVANSAAAVGQLDAFLQGGRCEIGAHLHPWINPPHRGPIDNRHYFPGNLPAELERAKLTALRDRIAGAFGAPPTIYKAGRYGIGAATAPILAELGFGIDVSIVPHTDFRASQGPDFTGFDNDPFETLGGVIALPLSVGFVGALASQGARLFPALSAASALRLPGIAARLGVLERLRLSPEGHRLADLTRQTRAALDQGQRFFMLTYHSSSLLPGASPYVRSEAERTAFLGILRDYLAFFLGEIGGRSLSISATAAAISA
jgi:hypothetical protein